jgi:hypothetical protein
MNLPSLWQSSRYKWNAHPSCDCHLLQGNEVKNGGVTSTSDTLILMLHLQDYFSSLNVIIRLINTLHYREIIQWICIRKPWATISNGSIATRKLIWEHCNERAGIAQSVQRLTTGWTIGWWGFESWRRLGIFLFHIASRPALRLTQPPIQRVPGALSLGIKRRGSEADHSPPSSAEVKECVELFPQYAFMAWCSVKKITGTAPPLP